MKQMLLGGILLLCLHTVPIVAQEEAAEEDTTRWSLTLGTKYLSQYTSYGVDLSDDQSALQHSLGITHRSGWSLGIDGIQVLGSNSRFQQWSMKIGYEYECTDWLTAGAGFSHTEYRSDTVSILAPLANSLALALDADFSVASVGITYDKYFGSNSAGYLGVNISRSLEWGKLIIMPMVQASWMSQEVLTALLKQNSGKGLSKNPKFASTTTSVTGLSSLSIHLVAVYPVGHGLTLAVHPYFLHSPKSEVSSKTSQLLFIAGVSYSLGL